MKLSFDFVKEQIEKEEYKLLSTKYINDAAKLKIKCPKGHEYEASYNKFNNGRRCPQCSNINRGLHKKLSYDFVKEQIEKEGYKLISTEYFKANRKVKIICSKGHEYEASYNKFQTGRRCPKCKIDIIKKLHKHSYEFVKEQIEKNGYKLISTEYINAHSKLDIQCDKGHMHETTWNKFQSGSRCFKCSYIERGIKSALVYDFVKEQIEKEGYKLISTEYSNAKEYLLIQCDKGHEYEVWYGNFQQGKRCPKCFGSFSRAEKEVAEYIRSFGLNVIENDRIIISPLELDIIIPEKKIAIEYCGLYWHSDLSKDKYYHTNKLMACNKMGYRLITLFEDEWINKQEIVKNRLRYILGLETKKIYARKCSIKEIETEQAKEFIDKYHIQGYSHCSIRLGAFYENELVAVMTFSNASNRGGKQISAHSFELNRFCTLQNIVGIASKFLKYFARNYKYDKIVTFADRRWSEGNLYQIIGFKKCYDVLPSYFYFKEPHWIRHHRFNFRKGVLKKKLQIFNPDKTEYQNMTDNGWMRIWDCGNIKYEMLYNGTYSQNKN